MAFTSDIFLFLFFHSLPLASVDLYSQPPGEAGAIFIHRRRYSPTASEVLPSSSERDWNGCQLYELRYIRTENRDLPGCLSELAPVFICLSEEVFFTSDSARVPSRDGLFCPLNDIVYRYIFMMNSILNSFCDMKRLRSIMP